MEHCKISNNIKKNIEQNTKIKMDTEGILRFVTELGFELDFLSFKTFIELSWVNLNNLVIYWD